MEIVLVLGAVAAAAAALSGKKKSGGRRGSTSSSSVQRVGPKANLLNPAEAMKAIGYSSSDLPELKFNIPFAAGSPSPIWPLVTNNPKKWMVSYRTVSGSIVGNGARRFMCSRDGGERYHVGIDLYGNPGDPVLAMEDGVIVNTAPFFQGTDAVYLQCKSGLVINYGEVKSNSWKEFGLAEGSKVKKGQPIARVGQMTSGSHMCHFETYMPGTTKNIRYFGGDTKQILNPTYYLLLALSKAGKGHAFAGVDCQAMATLNRPIPARLESVAREDERVGDRGGNSIVPALLIEGMWSPVKDEADGP
jgi:murein DD-endopeptidase MepM/ murein hydrolase activator NlpD